MDWVVWMEERGGRGGGGVVNPGGDDSIES